MTANAAVEQCPKGICLELLVLPVAERRGNQEFAAQLPHSPRSEAEGGTPEISGLCGAQIRWIDLLEDLYFFP